MLCFWYFVQVLGYACVETLVYFPVEQHFYPLKLPLANKLRREPVGSGGVM